MFNWLLNFFENFRKNNKQFTVQEQDQLLLYPYLSEKTLQAHPLIDEYNLERLYSTKNYLNHRIYPSRRHINLRPYFEQGKKLNWIGLISDVKRPQDNTDTPTLLIDKLAVINNETKSPKFLDYHIWLNTRYIKCMLPDYQTIAIGEAIRGISKIGTYLGKNGETKYGLYETVLIGSGIFVGKQETSKNQTNLNTKFVTDFDRHSDWFLKLSDPRQINLNKMNSAEFNRLFTLPNHVKIKYQDSQHGDYLQRRIAQSHIEQKAKKRANKTISFRPILKKVERKIDQNSEPLSRYHGRFIRYTYINPESNTFEPIIVLDHIQDELNKPIEDHFYFQINSKVIETGLVQAGEKINFATKSHQPTSATAAGKLKQFTPLITKKARQPLPQDKDALIGFIMFNRNDQTFDHLPFLEKYRAWAKERNIDLPIQKNRKLNNLLSKEQLKNKFNLSDQQFNSLIRRLRIKISFINDGVNYYDQDAMRKIQQELNLRIMLQNLKQRKAKDLQKPMITDKPKAKFNSSEHTIISTKSQQFYAEEFDTLTPKQIKQEINSLSSHRIPLYVLGYSLNDNANHYIRISNIVSFTPLFSEEIIKIKN